MSKIKIKVSSLTYRGFMPLIYLDPVIATDTSTVIITPPFEGGTTEEYLERIRKQIIKDFKGYEVIENDDEIDFSEMDYSNEEILIAIRISEKLEFLSNFHAEKIKHEQDFEDYVYKNIFSVILT